MKRLRITYDCHEYDADGIDVIGETCTEIMMTDDNAELVMKLSDIPYDTLRSDPEFARYCNLIHCINNILNATEELKGRCYRQNSIKLIEEVTTR